MISRYVAKYSEIITRHLASKYIRFPQSENEMTETKAAFIAYHHFPGTLGVIDGTQIAITALPVGIENAYINRKGSFDKCTSCMQRTFDFHKHECAISRINTRRIYFWW